MSKLARIRSQNIVFPTARSIAVLSEAVSAPEAGQILC